jgi:hypothetical protein
MKITSLQTIAAAWPAIVKAKSATGGYPALGETP